MENLHFSGPQSACKVCGGAAPLYGVVDFNKNCEEARGVFLPLVGVPVSYHQCAACGLIFSNAFDKWTTAEFRKYIYNDEYIKVDPDYAEARPRQTLGAVMHFIRHGQNLRVLDYGGGSGKLSRLLIENGVSSASWDPMAEDAVRPARNHFDLVVAFEVFEHTPTPRQTLDDALSCLKPDGVMLLSTMTADNRAARDTQFWYIAPRNGHITIFTRKALALLFSAQGYSIHHLNEGSHIAYKNLPAWVPRS